jgi:hypothetical protein
LIIIAILVIAPAATAQIGANLGGRVRDSTGGALPGASVTITNTNNGISQVLTTGVPRQYSDRTRVAR